MRSYHDQEWGVPSHDERHLFELLVLEGAQAGLSWATVLARREGYRRAFADFDPTVVAAFNDERLEALLLDPGIVRHRQKVWSARANARAFARVAEEHGAFADYLWAWVDGVPVVTRAASPAGLRTTTVLSDALSKDLRRRGFSFVGSTMVASYLQAVGVLDDHLAGCPAARD